jgi:protein-tyrosine sulfotransferase
VDRENHANAAPPVFILSCERSGSTLLRYIIDTHPQVCSPAHLQLGQLCSALYPSIFYSLGQTLQAADEAARERLVFLEVRRIVDEFLGRYASAKGKQVWCEKSPDNLRYCEILHKAFPDARYICLYRHCMDVVHSSIGCSRLGFLPEHIPYVLRRAQNLVAAMVENWVEKTNTLLECELTRHPAQCVRIKYEALVTAPSPTLAAMFAALGLDWDDSLLNAVFSTDHDQGPGDSKIDFTREIRSDPIGRGSTISRKNIPADLLDGMNRVLARLEYPLVGEDWDVSPSPLLTAAAPAGRSETDSSIAEMFGSHVRRLLTSENAAFRGISGKCRFDVDDGGGAWMLTFGESWGIAETADGDADCIVRMSATDLRELVNGRLNPLSAFEQGRIHVGGDYDLAYKVGRLLFSR